MPPRQYRPLQTYHRADERVHHDEQRELAPVLIEAKPYRSGTRHEPRFPERSSIRSSGKLRAERHEPRDRIDVICFRA